jgi:hypothetical protein
MHRWKRRWVATDSSAEQSPGVNCLTEAVLTMASGNGRRRRHQMLRCGEGDEQRGLGRVAHQFPTCSCRDVPDASRTEAFGPRSEAHRGRGRPACRAARKARLVTWGSASADRSITKAEHRRSAPAATTSVDAVATASFGARRHTGPLGARATASVVAQSGPVREPSSEDPRIEPSRASAQDGNRAANGSGLRMRDASATASVGAPARRQHGLRPTVAPALEGASVLSDASLHRSPRQPAKCRSTPVEQVRARIADSKGKRATAAVMRYGC